MKKLVLLLFFIILVFPRFSFAWECYVDPVYERDLWGQYNTAAYVLERECSGTAKLETVPAGTVLHIVAETDGWYKVETNNGNIGWTGAQLISLVDKPSISVNNIIPATTAVNACTYASPETLSIKGFVKEKANLRNQPCADNSKILQVLPAGTELNLVGKIPGWYQIKQSNGEMAWMVDWLITISSAETTAPAVSVPSVSSANLSFKERTKGQLLLQVESVGEIWYVDPIKYERYHATVANALPLFRKLALGITNADLAQITLANGSGAATALGLRLKGRLLLAVEDLGRVWYVDLNGFRQEVRQDNILTLFRSLGLGITNADLAQIPQGNLDGFGDENFINSNNSGTTDNNLWQNSDFQRGTVPAGIDLAAANNYWLSEINELRAARGLRQLVLDQRFVDTATEWAGYMGADLGYTTHTRPDGKSMHKWIDTKDLDWTVRYSQPDGWVTNYFTENIAWNYIDGNTEALKKAMDYTIDWMLAEASYNGDHYRTIYHSDWNCVGVGFYFKDMGNGRYQVFMAMHYGSLEQ